MSAPIAPRPSPLARVRRLAGVSGWNLAVASSADVVSKGLAIVSVALLARALGPEAFGTYSTIMAFVTLSLAVGGLGLDRLLYRELSAGLDALRLYKTTLAVRRVVVPVVVLAMVAYAMVRGEEVWPWALGALALVPALESALLSVLFQAQERFSVPARATVLHSLATCLYVAILARVEAPIEAYLAGFVATEGARLAFLRIQAWDTEWPDTGVEWGRLTGLLRSAAPYAVLTVLGIVYLRIDLIMLDAMLGGAEVGLYAGSTRVLFVAAAIPGLCLGVLFPRFVRLQREDPEGSARLYLLATRVMIWIGIAVTVTGALSAVPVLRGLYGADYVAGASALRWLMVALLATFAHASNGTVLFSSDRLRAVVLISVVTAGFNVLANLYAIPRWGGEGAAMTTAASEILSYLLFTPLVCHRLGVRPWTYARSVLTPRLSRADRNLLLDVPS